MAAFQSNFDDDGDFGFGLSQPRRSGFDDGEEDGEFGQGFGGGFGRSKTDGNSNDGFGGFGGSERTATGVFDGGFDDDEFGGGRSRGCDYFGQGYSRGGRGRSNGRSDNFASDRRRGSFEDDDLFGRGGGGFGGSGRGRGSDGFGGSGRGRGGGGFRGSGRGRGGGGFGGSGRGRGGGGGFGDSGRGRGGGFGDYGNGRSGGFGDYGRGRGGGFGDSGRGRGGGFGDYGNGEGGGFGDYGSGRGGGFGDYGNGRGGGFGDYGSGRGGGFGDYGNGRGGGFGDYGRGRGGGFGDSGRGRGGGFGNSGRGRGGGGGGGFGSGRDDFRNERAGADRYNNQSDMPDGSRGADHRRPPVTYVPKELDEADFNSLYISKGINFEKQMEVDVETRGVNCPAPKNSFQEFGFSDVLLKNISKLQMTVPTLVQRHAIPVLLQRRDLMVCAQTGSGKTAAFLLPIISLLEERERIPGKIAPQAAVVVPTRELAQQVFSVCRSLLVDTGFRCAVAYGGVSVHYQLSELWRGCDIVVATPGRLVQFMEMQKVTLNFCRFFIFDEADRMLDMGFEATVRQIASTLPVGEFITAMFSATFPVEVQSLARQFLRDDFIFKIIGILGSANLDIMQSIRLAKYQAKDDQLLNILREISEEYEGRNEIPKILIFVSRKRMADIVSMELLNNGFKSTSIHGDREQYEREKALRNFKQGKANVLVATDVAARGLDIAGVDYVINFDMPKCVDDYVHRIGRTGRVGNPGRAISFFSWRDDQAIAKDLADMLHRCGQDVPKFLLSDIDDDVEYSTFPSAQNSISGGNVEFGTTQLQQQSVDEDYGW